MAAAERLICRSDELPERGIGIRFEFLTGGVPVRGFVVRYQGKVFGYRNECAHVPIELDWEPGQFWDFSGYYLICSTHGATYLPDSGRCIAGPCKGRSLRTLQVVERDGNIYLVD